jgi:hypothetical protein
MELLSELLGSKKITVARNKAGRKAFMNNAPVDNFGTKECQYVPQSDAYSVRRTKKSKWMYSWRCHGRCGLLCPHPYKVSSAEWFASFPGGSGRHASEYDHQCSKSLFHVQCSQYALTIPRAVPRFRRQCNLKSKRRATKKSAKYEGVLLISTGYMVELIYPGKSCSHRFHIIKDAPLQFDMLYGVEFPEKTE